jgi:cation diffusion facilitator family transporter
MHGLSQEQLRYRETRKVTVVGAAIDLVLGIAKILVGVFAHSQALIADGVHSLSDLATDFMVLFAAKHASRDADEDHPYGHARFETAMTVALGVALVLVAAGIGYDAVHRLFEPELLQTPGWPALLVAGLSIGAKEGLYRYTMHVARRTRSNLLRANAWHHRSDAISSIVVVIGVVGAMAGLNYLDSVAAAGVAFMIAKIGWDLAWHSLRELVDTALETERVEAIRRTILGVGGVKGLHLLRTRRMGADALVDVHIQVHPKLSVSEGHQVSEMVRQRLINEVDEVSDVMVHIDPENDEQAQPCCTLPLRPDLMQKLKTQWQHIPAASQIDKVTLHYLGGKIHVELFLPISVVQSLDEARKLSNMLRETTKAVREIGELPLPSF